MKAAIALLLREFRDRLVEGNQTAVYGPLTAGKKLVVEDEEWGPALLHYPEFWFRGSASGSGLSSACRMWILIYGCSFLIKGYREMSDTAHVRLFDRAPS